MLVEDERLYAPRPSPIKIALWHPALNFPRWFSSVSLQMPSFLAKLKGELPEEKAKARAMVERDEDEPEREDEVCVCVRGAHCRYPC